MYARAEAKETDPDVLHRAIRDISFGTLVICDDTGAPRAVHLPAMLKTGADPTIEVHVARANPIWKLIEAARRPALVMFQGPQAYVRPGWYPTKQEHGKVVPTWAYVSVHARGEAALMTMDELLIHIREVSDQMEAGQEKPWSVDDAPEGFIPALARGIVGIRIAVAGIEGVWKLNQHRAEGDRLGMIEGFEAKGETELAAIMRGIEAARA